MLVPLLASEGIEPGHARQLLTEHHPGNRDILLKVFGETSSGPWTLNGYDPILVADFVFDWVGQQLKAATGDADCIRRLESRL